MKLKPYLSYVTFLVFLTGCFVVYQSNLTSDVNNFKSYLYLISIYGYYGLILIVLALIFYPIQRYIKPASYLTPIFFTLWILYWIADILVFRLYSFHLDGLLLQMLFFDFKGMGLPIFIMVLIVMVIVIILTTLYWVWIKLNQKKYLMSSRNIGLHIVLLLMLFLLNTCLSIWAKGYSRNEILVYNNYFPIYAPISSHSNAPKLSNLFPDFLPNEPSGFSLAETAPSGIVKYPLNPIICKKNSNPQNVIIIGLESWQSDSLNDVVMPKTMSLVKQGGVFYKNHLSGGTTTVPGLFSLLMGMEGSYYKRFNASPDVNSSVLVNQLHELDYQVNSFTASDFNRFNLRNLILPKVIDSNYIETKDDAETLVEIKKHVNRLEDNVHFLDFVFFVSSHSPYDYPDTYKKFEPLPKVEGGYAIDPYTDNTVYKNDYYNSLYYMDDLISQTLAAYDEKGLLQDTWIVITGDHAEEFNENSIGQWGHGSNFSRWQSSVPMIIIRPNDTNYKEEFNRTYHLDVLPTLMSNVLSCDNPVDDYSTGVNLYASKKFETNRNSVISSYYDDAYVIDDIVYEKNTGRAYKLQNMEAVANNRPNAEKFKEMINKESRFLK